MKYRIMGISARQSIFLAIAFSFLFALYAGFPSRVFADDLIEVSIYSNDVLPEPVRIELEDMFSGTLIDVLIESDETDQLLGSDPELVADAIRTGINIVIEPKGYTVGRLDLDFETTPVTAEFTVGPTGWTEEDPHAVLDVEVRLAADGLAPFWLERLGANLSENETLLTDAYREFLLGLPTAAIDSDWALDLVMPYLVESDPAKGIFPDYVVTLSVELGPTATVTLKLEPVGDIIELVRPRMYSLTLYNIILDRFRERLLAEADFIEGMPRSEIDAAADEIAARLEIAVEQDPLARRLNAYVSIAVVTLEDEPVVRIDTIVESRSYDLWMETYVDFGNESRDSTEIQARFGILLSREIEIFANLNFFTNDNTLETDLALGLRPTRRTFTAIGYDIERKSLKYFFEQELQPGFILRGEIFENDSLNEFGMTYQFQQYLSAGMFTNGNNEYWLRAIFAL